MFIKHTITVLAKKLEANLENPCIRNSDCLIFTGYWRILDECVVLEFVLWMLSS